MHTSCAVNAVVLVCALEGAVVHLNVGARRQLHVTVRDGVFAQIERGANTVHLVLD